MPKHNKAGNKMLKKVYFPRSKNLHLGFQLSRETMYKKNTI